MIDAGFRFVDAKSPKFFNKVDQALVLANPVTKRAFGTLEANARQAVAAARCNQRLAHFIVARTETACFRPVQVKLRLEFTVGWFSAA